MRVTRSKALAPSLDASASLELPATPAAAHSDITALPQSVGMEDNGFGGALGSDIMSGGLFEGGNFV